MLFEFIKKVAAVLMVVVPFSVQAADIGSSYRLDTGDKVSIKVYDEEDLAVETRLNDRGRINYSYLGEMEITGLTTQEVEELVANKLKDGYLLNPSVSVTVLEYRPFFINGEVSSPGDYPYQPGLTLEKAVSIAGGFTDRASRRKIYLLRGDSDERSRIGFQDGIEPGDIVTIEEGFF